MIERRLRFLVVGPGPNFVEVERKPEIESDRLERPPAEEVAGDGAPELSWLDLISRWSSMSI